MAKSKLQPEIKPSCRGLFDTYIEKVLIPELDFFDVGVEGIPVHGTGDHPRRNNPVAGQTRDQGPIAPSPEWGAPLEAFTAQAAPVFAGYPSVGARLIQKDQPPRLPAHGLLSTAPVMPCFSNFGRVALPGDQAFLYVLAIFYMLAMVAQQQRLARRRAQATIHQCLEPDPKGHRKYVRHKTSSHTG